MNFTIIALDSVIRSKLLYGIDSLQLSAPEPKRLEHLTRIKNNSEMGYHIHKQRKQKRENLRRREQHDTRRTLHTNTT